MSTSTLDRVPHADQAQNTPPVPERFQNLAAMMLKDIDLPANIGTKAQAVEGITAAWRAIRLVKDAVENTLRASLSHAIVEPDPKSIPNKQERESLVSEFRALQLAALPELKVPMSSTAPIGFAELGMPLPQLQEWGRAQIRLGVAELFRALAEYLEDAASTNLLGRVEQHPADERVVRFTYFKFFIAKVQTGETVRTIAERKVYSGDDALYRYYSHEQDILTERVGVYRFFIEKNEHLLIDRNLDTIAGAVVHEKKPLRICQLLKDVPMVLRTQLRLITGTLINNSRKIGVIKERAYRDSTFLSETTRVSREYCPGLSLFRTYCLAGWLTGEP